MNRDPRGELDPDRTRVRAEATRATPTRAMPAGVPAAPVKLEDISLNMATSIPLQPLEKTAIASGPERAAKAEPETGHGGVGLALASGSAIFLALALAAVVIIGQKRIGELSELLRATQGEWDREKAARQSTEGKNSDLSARISDLERTLGEREQSLRSTERQAQRLKETGEKTKAELQNQVEDLTDKLRASEEDLADARKARAAEQAEAKGTIEKLEGSLSTLGQLKDNIERDRAELRRDLSAERRTSSDLAAENRKLKDDQGREQAAVKRLLVQLTEANQTAETERARRQKLEDQLRRHGITPEGSAPPPPPRRDRGSQYQSDDGDVEERDLGR